MTNGVAEQPDSLQIRRMKGRQCRAARELLGMSQVDLAKAAGVSRPTLQAIETETGDPKRSSLMAVEGYLRSRGIRFSDEVGVVGVPPEGVD